MQGRLIAFGRCQAWMSLSNVQQKDFFDYIVLSNEEIIKNRRMLEVTLSFAREVDARGFLPKERRSPEYHKKYKKWKKENPGWKMGCPQLGAQPPKNIEELERRFGLRADDPIGAVEVLHACKALKGLIWSQYLSARGEKARAKVQANLDKFIGNRSFKDCLSSDMSLVMQIICDPEAAFGETAENELKDGWEEFLLLCYHAAEIYSYCGLAAEKITRAAKLAIWLNCFGANGISNPRQSNVFVLSYACLFCAAFGCLIIDLCDCGHFSEKECAPFSGRA